MHSRLNGPLPPRRTRSSVTKAETIPRIRVDHFGPVPLLGDAVRPGSGVFFEKEKPSQAAEASGDLAALPGSADPEGISGDEDMELTQEKPDESGEKPTKEAEAVPRRRPRTKSRSGRNPGEGKSECAPSGKRGKTGRSGDGRARIAAATLRFQG